MSFEDEIDHEEHAAVSAAIADERESEAAGEAAQDDTAGWIITLQVKYSPEYPDAMIDEDMMVDLRDRLVSVAELWTNYQSHAFVTSHVRAYPNSDVITGKQFISPRAKGEQE